MSNNNTTEEKEKKKGEEYERDQERQQHQQFLEQPELQQRRRRTCPSCGKTATEAELLDFNNVWGGEIVCPMCKQETQEDDWRVVVVGA